MSNPGDIGDPIRVFIFDDHKIILWGLEHLIESAAPLMHWVGSADKRDEIVGRVLATSPDVVVLDVDVGEADGTEVVRHLVRESGARVLILTGRQDPDLYQRAMMCGASGVVQTQESPDTLLRAIERVAVGEVWLNRAVIGRVIEALAGGRRPQDDEALKIASLTERERKIIAVAIENKGARNKVIADQLHISEHTLRNHLAAIYRKLGVNGRIELYLYAVSHGLNTHLC
ncbi:response regulator transcription factor [Thauera aromatica]|nr:response regulator transcription factor [Thauera aromatica]MCK2125432.1 response regulator transcription factor [Thauera aromatica]